MVVPVLDEERRIGRFLAHVAGQPGVHEVIVVDGGSTDQTVELVRASPWCRLLRCEPGRACQMNAGARTASGDVLLFLHADVRLPSNGAALIAEALADPRTVGGAFRIHTVADGRAGWAARWLRLADLRSRYTRLPYGDQAIFVRREVFDRVGGFPRQLIFEDLELSRRLRRVGRVRTLRACVDVSGRRFMERPAYYALIMTVLPWLYRLGVPPAALARAYPHVR